METTPKANLTEDQFNKIINFMEEARAKHMQKLYVSVGGSILLAIPGLITLSSIQSSKAAGLSGHFGNLWSDAAFVLWLICLGATVVFFLTGYQKQFGSQCQLNRFKRHEFSCEHITVGELSGSEGKPPYLMKDSFGSDYICPVYLEFKQLKVGGPAIGVYLTGGERYAVHNPANDYV